MGLMLIATLIGSRFASRYLLDSRQVFDGPEEFVLKSRKDQ